MDVNPYAPPKATVADVLPAETSPSEPVFFAVSPIKLLVLNFSTMGLYQYYWFYKQWKNVDDHEPEAGLIVKRPISPFWRAFFTPIFCYSLFKRIKTHDVESPAAGLKAGPLAAAWVIPTVLARLHDPYWMVMFLAVFALLPVQAAAHAINQAAAPGHNPNARFTAWNWVAVVVGGPFLLLAVFATLFPTE